MKCNNCGNEIENGSNFCPYCGARLSDDSVNRQQSVYVGNTSNGQIQQPIGKTLYNQMPNKAPASKGKEKTSVSFLSVCSLFFQPVFGTTYCQTLPDVL